MDGFCLITTTCDKEEVSERITDHLLEKRLVACVQKCTISSSYHWKGKRENTNEILLQMKTRTGLYQAVEKEILRLHDYETPEIVMVEVKDGFSGYLDWVRGETK